MSLTRNPALTMLHCYSCDKELDSMDLRFLEVFDGMCEDCYAEAMDTAYSDGFEELE